MIAPLFEGTEPVLREHSTVEGLIIREIYVPMSNLNKTEEFLGNVIERFA